MGPSPIAQGDGELYASDQVRNPSSTLIRFLDRTLPHRNAIVDAWRRAMGRIPAYLPDSTGNPVLIGRAFEIRVALDIVGQPSYEDLFSWLPPGQTNKALHAAGFAPAARTSDDCPIDPLLTYWRRTGRPDSSDAPLDDFALVACLDAAAVDRFHRTSLAAYPVQSRRGFLEHVHGMGVPRPRADGVDHQNLRLLWSQYVLHGRQLLLELGGPAVAQVVVTDAFAEADLVVGATVVDIKAVRNGSVAVAEWLDQVLAYALLDHGDVYGIDAVAIYDGWRSHLLRADLSSILRASTGGSTPTLSDLRDELHSAVKDEVERARVWRARTQHTARLMLLSDEDDASQSDLPPAEADG